MTAGISGGEYVIWFFDICLYCLITDALDSKFSDESEDGGDESIKEPERLYRGPHLTFPITKSDVDTLIDFFRKKKVRVRSTRIYFLLNFCHSHPEDVTCSI